VPDIDNPRKATLVSADGSREEFKLTHDQSIAFGRLAAVAFGIGEAQTVKFDYEQAKKDIAGESDVKATRKKATRNAAVLKSE
jgi:hypothetical protein